ncbi:MAG TPA: amidoligase family protein [Kofleriaceae bacterium]|nr:amidoligase family protein [Kofleriaceae bacterium]
MKDLQFGVEIETVGLTHQELARAIHAAVGATQPFSTHALDTTGVIDACGRSWRIVPDGSLTQGSGSGEIVTPILGYDDLDLLQRVVREVAAAGARADESTGIHVHVGANRFDAQSIARLVKMVHKQERLLEHALGISERRLARFCKPVEPTFLHTLETRRPRTLKAVNKAWYGRHNTKPSRYDATRYHGINLNSFYLRRTIEFRYFNGSVDADKVKAYVHLVLALAAKALRSKGASSMRREFRVETAKYDWRVFLLSLGLIGDEFKVTRKHLTQHLAGSAAWKGERRDKPRKERHEAATTHAASGEPSQAANPAASDDDAPTQRDPADLEANSL